MLHRSTDTPAAIPTPRINKTVNGRRRACSWTARWITVLLLGSTGLGDALAEPARTPIAVVDFDYADTSGEVRDQSAFHSRNLQQFVGTIRTGLEQSGLFRVVPITCQPDPCSITATDPTDLLDAARRAGARLLLFGGIHKMSTLVQWAKAQIIDVQTEKIVFDRLMTFRGDDDGAWRHAEGFLLKDITAQSFPQ